MRTARSGYLETRSARLRLKAEKKPYWTRTGKEGVHLGYRRRKPRTGDANGSWVVRRYTGEGYQTEVFAEADDYSEADGGAILSYAQAIKKLDGALSERQRGARYTVQNAVDDYVAWLKTNKKSGRDVEWKLKHYILKYFEPTAAVSSLTWEDNFKGWPQWAIKNKPRGRRKKVEKQAPPTPEQQRQRKSTINKTMNLVKACFTKAYVDNAARVPSDAAWKRLRRFKGVDSARLHWLTNEESQRLINASEPDFRKIVMAGLLTGARWSELRALTARDYDARSGKIHIVTSKADKPRHVPLNAEGKAAFEHWTTGMLPGTSIFTRTDGEQWGEQDQKRPMTAACEGAGIEPTVGFHTLRHSYASALVQAGTSLAIVAEALGHADTRMVSKHYGHLAPSHVADAISANLPSLGIEFSGKVKALKVAK